MESWSDYFNRYYGPKTGYYASTNGIRSEYRAWNQKNTTGSGYTPYPIYTPRYSNTNDSYIRSLDRSMSWGLYRSITTPVDPWGYPKNLGRREDGDRIRRAQFEGLYANGVFDVIDRGDYFKSASQLRAFIDEDNQRRYGEFFGPRRNHSNHIAKVSGGWVEEIENGRRVKKLYMGSEGGLDMDGNFNPNLVRRVVRTQDLGLA